MLQASPISYVDIHSQWPLSDSTDICCATYNSIRYYH